MMMNTTTTVNSHRTTITRPREGLISDLLRVLGINPSKQTTPIRTEVIHRILNALLDFLTENLTQNVARLMVRAKFTRLRIKATDPDLIFILAVSIQVLTTILAILPTARPSFATLILHNNSPTG
jgi:hypothetical protein